ncbi:replication initiator protein A [Palleronia caenipelagi]|uniref:Replication initiator protein A n=1 Tax=Palleronia caenipelagi TaxID=2489174 RepID=A0A547PMR2_9RHOB|nr:replication initiator protein A [Palleronia caenipelagi]TRD15430.1 replication initiator protein A [Palleronia caenipelagi]
MNQRPALLPDRHPTPDFFVCDIFDAAPKSDMASMEHPIFSLSTKPDYRVREYENNGAKLTVKPSSDGLATVHDRDVLIYCISQIIRAMNDGKPVSRRVRFNAGDLMRVTNRQLSGRGYSLLKTALERLRGTAISTNIVTGGKEVFRTFGLIDSAEIVRETYEGRMQEVEVVLSDWVFNAIEAKEVLTIHRDYFRLRRPLERRLYELARKHCGMKKEWRIGMELLQKKCGSSSSSFEFRRLMRNIVQDDERSNHIPDYALRLSDDGNQLIVQSRGSLPGTYSEAVEVGPLDPETYEMARDAAPGWDVRVIEQEWRAWMTERPRNPDAAFIGFCAKWSAKRGTP